MNLKVFTLNYAKKKSSITNSKNQQYNLNLLKIFYYKAIKIL